MLIFIVLMVASLSASADATSGSAADDGIQALAGFVFLGGLIITIIFTLVTIIIIVGELMG